MPFSGFEPLMIIVVVLITLIAIFSGKRENGETIEYLQRELKKTQKELEVARATNRESTANTTTRIEKCGENNSERSSLSINQQGNSSNDQSGSALQDVKIELVTLRAKKQERDAAYADLQRELQQTKRELEQHLAETWRVREARRVAHQQELDAMGRTVMGAAHERDSAIAALKQHEKNLAELLKSNLTSAPWLAGMIADFLTYDLEVEAKKLDWGKNVERAKKVASIREIRAEAQRRIAEAKEAVYQLEYLKQLYPALEDVLETSYNELEFSGEIPDYDPVRKYLSKEEWLNLSDTERNQLALDRYVASRRKSKWQIGRDYELAVAYEYSQKGYKVDTCGSYLGFEDMGRDLIAKAGDTILIVQCKYWGHEKQIHEKHIFQLFGSVITYCMENNCSKENVKGVFVTNITLSETARRMAQYLGIRVAENHEMVEFPRIKCNIGRGENGTTHIYHLPMDMQYDVTKIENTGEFYAFTVREAEEKGFRRTYKWHGTA